MRRSREMACEYFKTQSEKILNGGVNDVVQEVNNLAAGNILDPFQEEKVQNDGEDGPNGQEDVVEEEPGDVGVLQEELMQNDGGDGWNAMNIQVIQGNEGIVNDDGRAAHQQVLLQQEEPAQEPIEGNEGAENDDAGAAQEDVVVQDEEPVQGQNDEPLNANGPLKFKDLDGT